MSRGSFESSRRHPVDVLVGKRIRMLRIQRSLSQSELAEALGLTFQQIQKYEKGANRVSCSRLFEIARTLNAPIAYFFGDDGADVGFRAAERLDGPDLKDGIRLIAAYSIIGDRAVRRKFVDLLEGVAESAKHAHVSVK